MKFSGKAGKESYEKFAAIFAPLLEKSGGAVVLSANTEMPIVSDKHWDHFVAFRFKSVESMKKVYQSDAFQEANALRMAALEDSLAVLSEPEAIPGQVHCASASRHLPTAAATVRVGDPRRAQAACAGAPLPGGTEGGPGVYDPERAHPDQQPRVAGGEGQLRDREHNHHPGRTT